MDFFRSSAQQKPTVNFRRASSNVWLGFRDSKGSLTQPEAEPRPDSRRKRDARCVASWSANSQEWKEGKGACLALLEVSTKEEGVAASNAGENHVLARSHSTKRERWEKGDNRKAGSFVVRLRDRVRCGRSDQILEYIARSIEEETDGRKGIRGMGRLEGTGEGGIFLAPGRGILE